MAFLLPPDLSNLQLEVFSSQLKLRLPYFDQCQAVLEAAVLWAANHASCWLSETCCGVGSARPLPVRVSSSFQVPFYGGGNCTHWHLGLFVISLKERPPLLRVIMVCLSSFVNCLFLTIMIAIYYFLQCNIVQIMLQRVEQHSLFQHCFYTDRGFVSHQQKLGHL